jgi:uncharacterized protein YdhG (YjbR/CyaY superfamily)
MTTSKDAPKTTRTTTGNTAEGFTDEERAAIKERAAELRAEGKKGARQADGLQAVLDSIAKMAPQDRTLAERVHVTVTANAPDLSPKTWYGMPAYANAEGKVIVAFKNAGKFNTRYATLEFQDAAHLDDGEIWPVSYALGTWSPVVEKQVAELVKVAIS